MINCASFSMIGSDWQFPDIYRTAISAKKCVSPVIPDDVENERARHSAAKHLETIFYH